MKKTATKKGTYEYKNQKYCFIILHGSYFYLESKFNLKCIPFLSEFNMKSSLSQDIKVKIVSFLDATLNKQIPWIVLENFMDELTPSLEKAKQVIKILLKIIQDDQKSVGVPRSVYM